ncbi:MAG: PEP-CTERM sorting domain-containing protein, partial [Opitutae bacterium]|nr:PEP-CTERM sorting domain-containing protein [Opitutae bacterium]
ANIYSTQSLGAAVPEPSTYALFLGVFSLGFVIWRKRAVKNTAKE